MIRRPRLWRALGTGVVALSLTACGIAPEDTSTQIPADPQLAEAAIAATEFSDLRQLAYTRNTLLQFSAAEQDYRDTLSLARRLFPKDPALASSIRLSLALNKSNLGQYETAEDLFAQSRPVVERLGTQTQAAQPDLFYAQHLMNQKRFAEAELLAADAESQLLEILRAFEASGGRPPPREVDLVQNPDGTFELDTISASIANAREETAPGIDGSTSGLSARQTIQLQLVHAYYVRARAFAALGRARDRIEALLQSGEDILSVVPVAYGRWLRAEFASLNADALAEVSRYDDAIGELDRAIAILRRFEVDTRPESLLLFKKASVQLEAERPSDARQTFRAAMEIIRTDEQGLEFEQAEALIDLLLAEAGAGDATADAELFTLMQKIRSSATAQTVAQLSARLSSGDSERAQNLREVQNLEREINVLSARFDRLEADPNADIHIKRVTETKLNDTRAALETARESLGDSASNYDQLVDATISLDKAQALLKPGEMMAVIQLGEQNGLVGIVTAESFDAYRIDMSTADAERDVRALRYAIDGVALVRYDLDRAYRLFDTLMGPVADRLESIDHLVVVPAGPFMSLPFNILVTERYEKPIEIVDFAYFDYSDVPWLGATKGVTTGVSISSFFLGRRVAPSKATRPFRGFGDFREFGNDLRVAQRIARQRELTESCYRSVLTIGNLGELPGTREELLQVQDILGVSDDDIVLRDAFDDSSVKEMPLGDFRILHFATHGLLAQHPECLPEPALVTSIAPDGDALLEASEIVDLVLDADLVVMSACDTGAGAGEATEEQLGFRGVGGSYAAGGESLNGLARSFFFAGARNVLSTHWSVDDLATQELMVLFYTTVADDPSASIAESMRRAQVSLIDGAELSHPFFWASFSVIGDGARTLKVGSRTRQAARTDL